MVVQGTDCDYDPFASKQATECGRMLGDLTALGVSYDVDRTPIGPSEERMAGAWMVGDQLFTDVLGGNLAGMHTILVRPLSVNALPHTRATRKLERAVLKRYGHDWRP